MKKVLITQPDQLAQALRIVLDTLADIGFGTPSYGFFPGGDPRAFTPDAESSTDAELARWKIDCALWDAGDQSPIPPSCVVNKEPLTLPTKTGEMVIHAPGTVITTRSSYGPGVILNAKEQNIKMGLEDLYVQCIRAAKEGPPMR